jgi:hypothetical protein
MNANSVANPAAGRVVITGARETVEPGPDAEFRSFDALASKLVRVPKSEIDEQREKHDRA